MKKLAILLMAAVLTQVGFGKTVGLHKDIRSVVTDGLVKTLQEAGWQTVVLDDKALADEAALAGVDVVFLSGGWGAYFVPDFNGRRALTKFVAGGKGILSSGFRSGYTRTANRPLFPQVGAAHNRVNGTFIVGTGDSDLAKAIDRPFSAGSWDHMTVKPGPAGNVFALVGGDPVGVSGELYGGRYVAFGSFLGSTAVSNAMTNPERRMFLKTLEWLASAPKQSEAEKAKNQAQADLDFLRREKSWDWTLNERGPDRAPGLIPAVRNQLAVPLESRLFRLGYMSGFLSGKPHDAVVSAIDELKKAVAQLDARTQAYTAETIAKINGMNAAELMADPRGGEKAFDLSAYEPAVRERLFPAAPLEAIKSRTDRVLADLQSPFKAAKAAQLAKERQVDVARLPVLIKDATSDEVNVRREAVLELGRIGESKGASTLIAALADKDEKVRIHAILGLGWMQARDGVPALIKLAEGPDPIMKRRAVQALGQIGDPRAAKALQARIADPDTFTAENAIFALGWLKSREAVPELLKIVTTYNKNNGLQRGLMLAAIRALGAIGDPAALPALETIRTTAADFPAPLKKAGQRIANIYSTAQSIGLEGHAELAIAALKAGGAARPGIEQAAFLASKDRFYALSKRFNALAGRPFITLQNFKDDWTALLPYLKEAGMTGLHNAWGEQEVDPDKYFQLIQAAGDLDLIWVETWPTDSNMFGGKVTVPDSRQMALEKAAGDACALRYRNEPAFAGFWSEEEYPWVRCEEGEFEAWFKAKYGEDPRKKYGLPADFVLPYWGQGAHEIEQMAPAPLKAEYLQFCGEKIMAHWRESQEWMQGLRKGCALTFSITHRQFASYIGLTGGGGDAIAVNGPEAYQSFGRDNAFLMEMFKDGRARPVMCEFYNWYTPSPAHEIRGFAQHLMHGECFYNFDLHQIFGQASSYYMWNWEATRWNHARTIFQKAARIKEYLEVPESAAVVAQLCSETTASMVQDHRSPLGSRWYQQQAALWTALGQSQIAADVISSETLSPDKLARYRVIVMADAKILTEAQADLIRKWVQEGGVLIAGGSSSLFDFQCKAQQNYRLADLFGVDYAGFAGVTDPARNDTLTFRLGEGALPVESSMAWPAVRDHVHREVKPVKSIGVYTVPGSPALPGLAAGTACEYDMPLGYDKVKPVAAEVLATFANGDPALTLNRAGKGLCYFWTPIYPALGYVGSGWENDANSKDFWPAVRELLAAMVKGGLAQRQIAMPVEIENVSKEVEVTLRQQPDRNRMMVHLLNYDTRVDLVKAPRLIVHPAAGRTVKRIFYPDTATEAVFSTGEGGVTAPLRDFNVHDMVVIEWAP